MYTIDNDVHEDLMLLKTWFAESKLSLNVTNTQILLRRSLYKMKALDRSDSFKLSLSIGDELTLSLVDMKYQYIS